MGGAEHDRTLVMGIVNVTPDSFSDGGHWLDPDAAVQHALELLRHGADILDVGGESTRPGALRVDPAQEIERVVPVVRALAERGAVVSVDTMRAQVAEACIRVGAQLVNDVSGGLADVAMLPLIARHDVDYVAMHWRGHARTMQQQASYSNVVADVLAELSTRRDAALAAGVQPDRLILDPGLGFAKRAEHNWQLLAALPRLMELGPRILVGASRKAFLGELLDRREPATREDASLAVTCHCAQRRVWAVRTHTAQPHADAVRVMQRLAAGGQLSAPLGCLRLDKGLIVHNHSDTSLDWIRLIGLTGLGRHGVFEFERAEPHDFVVDVHLGVAALTADDHVGASVDYSVIAADVVAILEGDPVNLIETLAHRVAERCLEEEPVVRVSVTVHKPQAPVGVRFTDVAVTLNRSKHHQTSDSGSRE